MRRLDGLLFLLFLSWPVVLVSTAGPPMADSVLLATIRLVDDGTWTLADDLDPKTVFLTRAHDISVHDGRVYSGVAPGASVVAAPFYLALEPLLSRFDDEVLANRRVLSYYRRNSLSLGLAPAGHFAKMYLLQLVLVWCLVAPLFALLPVRLYRMLRARDVAGRTALLVALALGPGTMALYYSTMYSRQALAYLLLWHALLFLFESGARPGGARCLAAGALAGVALSVEYSAGLLVALSLPFVLPRLGAARATLAALPLLAALGLTALYQQSAFGSFLDTPYHHRYWFTPAAVAAHGLDFATFEQGGYVGMGLPSPAVMLRLCFGRYKGLFLYSPILLLGLIGHLRAIRSGTGRRGGLYCLAVFGGYLAFNSAMGAHMTRYAHFVWGGMSVLWGPRHLFAVLPFLACGLAGLDWGRAGVRRWVYALLALSCALNLLGAMFGDRVMGAAAFGPDLRFPLLHVVELFFTLGPRVPLLDGYGVQAAVQAAVIGALLVSSGWLVRACLIGAERDR